MAGRPQTRARKLATVLKQNGIDPEALLTNAPKATAPPPHALGGVEALDELPESARTRTRTRERQATRPSAIGPTTRAAVDYRTASDLDQLATQLQPGMLVRVERTRPTFAAGWIEDITIDDHDLGAVLEYLAAEHGGQLYRATVIAPDGQQLYTARLPIAGPPKRRGRVLPRSAWDGSDDDGPRALATPTHTNDARPDPIDGFVRLFEVMRGGADDRNDAILRAMAETQKQNNSTVGNLLAAVMHQRESTNVKTSLRGQLAELREATEAVDEIREAFAVDRDDEPRDNDRSAVDSFAADILKAGMQNEMRKGAQAPAAAPQQRPQQRRPPPPNFRRVAPQPRQPPPKAPTQ